MTPDEQREYDHTAAAEWSAYQAAHANTCARLAALGLAGETLAELAAAADRLERMGALGRL
jgi:hypothetical protein